MSKQVEVTNEMANVLDGMTFNKWNTEYLNDSDTFLCVIADNMKYKNVFDLLKDQGIEKLENIYKYGYKRKYEFKVGDVVSGTSIYGERRNWDVVSDEEGMSSKGLPLSFVNNDEVEIDLVCKAENREDKDGGNND